MARKRRVGVYLTTPVILRNPDYLKVLQDEIGLNLALINFSGKVSEEVIGKSPFDGVPLSDACLESLLSRHMDGSYLDPREYDQVRACVGPSLSSGGDDEPLRHSIQTARQAGLEIWMCVGSWTGGHLMFCPGNDAVNTWYEAFYVHCATQYDVDGLDLSHARFPRCSVPRGLFACTCARCANKAADLGYDMDTMVGGLREGFERLKSTNAGLLARMSRTGAGFFDYLHLMGMRAGIVDWFRFRAELLAGELSRYRGSVHAAAGAHFVFGSDTYPASLAPLVGHNLTVWDKHSDFASPLVSHISSFVANGLVAWTQWLRDVIPALGEADALQTAYRFAGYDGMGLPETIAAYGLDQPSRLPYVLPLEELILRDLRKARLLLPPEMPSYPIIHGKGWPKQAIDAIVAGADEIGHDGIVWQGTDELVEFELK